jgi:hypothetical protein
MTASQQLTGQRDLQLNWLNFEQSPILFANHFLFQYQPDEFVLTLGQVTESPLAGGRPEPAPIRTICRVGLSRHRLVELIDLLQGTLQEHDRTVRSPS